MRILLSLSLSLGALLAGCPEPGTSGTGPDGTSSGGDDNVRGGEEVPARAPDESHAANLSEGSQIDISWAETNFCWVATENENFTGNHVFFNLSQPAGEDIYLRALPDSDVDVSLYILQYGAGQGVTPPNVSSPYECDAMHDQTNNDNPGQGEVLFLQNNIAFDVVVGVAGANGATSGAFTLEVWREDGRNMDQE